jgi:hypothetical protein
MKRLTLAISLSLALPAFAEEPKTEGFSLMEEGAKLVLRGLMTEMEPAFDEMEKALDDMQPLLKDIGPQFAELMALMGDIRNYDTPVVLPNGDILIRRKVPLAPKFAPGPNGEIDL